MIYSLPLGPGKSLQLCCAIVLTGTRCPLHDVSVWHQVSVKLVQGCEWHRWNIW